MCNVSQQPHRSKPQNVCRSVSVGHVHQHSAAHLIKRTLCSLQQEFSVIKCQECVLNRVTVRSLYNSSQQHMKLLLMNTETAQKKIKITLSCRRLSVSTDKEQQLFSMHKLIFYNPISSNSRFCCIAVCLEKVLSFLKRTFFVMGDLTHYKLRGNKNFSKLNGSWFAMPQTFME